MSKGKCKPCKECELFDASCIGQKGKFNPQLCVAILRDDGEMACRVCGCTLYRACPGGCYWVEPGLCSNCIDKEKPLQNSLSARRIKNSGRHPKTPAESREKHP